MKMKWAVRNNPIQCNFLFRCLQFILSSRFIFVFRFCNLHTTHNNHFHLFIYRSLKIVSLAWTYMQNQISRFLFWLAFSPFYLCQFWFFVAFFPCDLFECRQSLLVIFLFSTKIQRFPSLTMNPFIFDVEFDTAWILVPRWAIDCNFSIDLKEKWW